VSSHSASCLVTVPPDVSIRRTLTVVSCNAEIGNHRRVAFTVPLRPERREAEGTLRRGRSSRDHGSRLGGVGRGGGSRRWWTAMCCEHGPERRSRLIERRLSRTRITGRAPGAWVQRPDLAVGGCGDCAGRVAVDSPRCLEAGGVAASRHEGSTWRSRGGGVAPEDRLEAGGRERAYMDVLAACQRGKAQAPRERIRDVFMPTTHCRRWTPQLRRV
jgi:hypothetical protein